ncbi:hypothetical protein KM707_gp2 [Coconut foliar decay alphasatellite 2]|uniref:Uncharacterized protein n=1 Tax=Coconut foliar decay alphasatellite 2 TaxID=2161875 RepID=A0A2R4N9B0_9VIRU|nr:hypothetical protein KM707_gp2 [Coconut foliar decay alphasatellite 2]AVX29423.1 hypothetical protein [Coconut foliar decay alphasatellite 2]
MGVGTDVPRPIHTIPPKLGEQRLFGSLQVLPSEDQQGPHQIAAPIVVCFQVESQLRVRIVSVLSNSTRDFVHRNPWLLRGEPCHSVRMSSDPGDTVRSSSG